MKQYIFKLHENGHDYIPWFVNKTEEKFVKTKKCPTCKQSVEKVEGCDYIYCVCGKDFCWRCLKPWNHGFDHFGCKEPVAEHEVSYTVHTVVPYFLKFKIQSNYVNLSLAKKFFSLTKFGVFEI